MRDSSSRPLSRGPAILHAVDDEDEVIIDEDVLSEPSPVKLRDETPPGRYGAQSPSPVSSLTETDDDLSSGEPSVPLRDSSPRGAALAELAPPPALPPLPRRPATSGSNRPARINLGRKELLGKGSYGVVYRAMDLDTNRILAVKELTLVPGSLRPEQLESIRRELSVMQRLDHPNIVKCLGEHWDGEQFLRIYMEYVAGGTVSSILRSFGPFREAQASRYTKQMLHGLSYLHDRRIAHRDLKGDNLLVEVDGTLKLADFGTAKELRTATNSVAGTAYFMAPEVVRGIGHGVEADVWSVGCCVLEMLSGKPPFSDFVNQYAIMMHVAEMTEEKVPVPSGSSASAQQFVRDCLRIDPKARATVPQLLASAWIIDPPTHDTAGLRSINVVSDDAVEDLRRSVAEAQQETDSFNPVESYEPLM